MQMQLKTIPIGDLTPADYNPRKELGPGDPEFDKLKRSLDEFGYVEPVIWNKTTGRVVGGHQRITALKALGYEDVDCVVVELDETREKALNVALNKMGLLRFWLSPRLLRSGERSWKDNGHADQVQRGVQA